MNIVAQQSQAELERFRFSRESKAEARVEKSRSTLVYADDKTRRWRTVSGFVLCKKIKF